MGRISRAKGTFWFLCLSVMLLREGRPSPRPPRDVNSGLLTRPELPHKLRDGNLFGFFPSACLTCGAALFAGSFARGNTQLRLRRHHRSRRASDQQLQQLQIQKKKEKRNQNSWIHIFIFPFLLFASVFYLLSVNSDASCCRLGSRAVIWRSCGSQSQTQTHSLRTPPCHRRPAT